MSTIPASALVNVLPGVISAGGSGLNLIGLCLTNSTRVPIGSVQSFASQAAVAAFFGATAQEATLAATYFTGQNNASQVPAALLFAQYPSVAVSAYLRGGNISSLTLAQLQALNGSLGLTIDGALKTASISLAAATSFSNAAAIIANGLLIQGPQAATFTGSIGGSAGPTNVLTITALSSGTVGVGDVLTNGTGVPAGTYITTQLSGSIGGTGTYQISTSVTVLSTAITAFAPAVQFDSVSGAFILSSATTGSGSTITFGSGAFATSLLLTQVTGAILSQGTGAAAPVAFMNALVQVTQNWATFFTAFNPDASGNANKLLFAQWTSQQNNRYAYLVWDNDASPTVTVPATASLGQLILAASYSGTSLWYDPTNEGLVAAVSGSVAQLNFNQTNGRATIAFDTYAGLVATVTNQQVASNLIANGYNFYGAYATANANFVVAYPGSISGPFLWLDSYVNQIWLNSQLQLALLQLLTAINSIPYNAAGNSLIEAALASPIQAALNFGAIRAGVVLSSSQIIQINTAAGASVAGTVSNQGWYLQVLAAAPAVRAARTSPPINLWYADGQSVQQITMNSLEVQ